MTDIRGMRDIKTVQGLTSCTYWEAVLKLHYIWKAKPDNTRLSWFAVTLSIIFQRNVQQISQDIERGTP